MIVSAVLMGIIGLAFLFMPQEVLGLHGTTPDNATVLLLQMAGAVYLGFALVNWGARGVLIGGVYSRPVAAGNFFHFAIVSITLIKAAISFAAVPLMISAAVFTVFAVWFGLVMFRSPV
jgi:hypothetical protein